MLLKPSSRNLARHTSPQRRRRLFFEPLEERRVLAIDAALLKDIAPGADSGPNGFVQYGSNVYFNADDGTTGLELWRSDGTTATLFANLHASGNSNPKLLTVANGKLFFTATTPTTNKEVWATDGVSAPTVFDVKAGSLSSLPDFLTSFNSELYFTADNGTGMGLWHTNGIAAATLVAGTAGLNPASLIVSGGKLYFSAIPTAAPSYSRLYSYDGSSVQALDIASGTGSYGPQLMVDFGGTIYFSGFRSSPATGQELFKVTGPTSVDLVLDIRSGPANSTPANFTVAGTNLFFKAFDGTATNLWRTYSGGTQKVTDPIGVTIPSTTSFVSIGSLLYFVGTSTSGTGIFTSDGTTITSLPLTFGMSPDQLTNVGGTLYFAGTKAANGRELWYLNGSTPTLVKEIAPGSSPSLPGDFAAIGSSLYFSADNGTDGIEPWIAKDFVATPSQSLSQDGSGNLVITDNINGPDDITLQTNGSGGWTITGVGANFGIVGTVPAGITASGNTISVPASASSSFGKFIFNTTGGSDKLTVKLDSLGKRVDYDGGESASDNDRLVVQSVASYASETTTLTSTGGGDLDFGSDGSIEIHFANLEPVDTTGVAIASKIINLPAGSTATLKDYLAAADGFMQLTFNGTGPEDERFQNPSTSLTINATGGGTNLIQFETPDNGFAPATLNFTGTTAASDTFRLAAGFPDVLPNASNVVMTNATLSLNNQNDTIGSLAGTGALSLGSGTLTTGNATNTSYSGLVSGSGGLVKQGAGTMTLSGTVANTYGGGTLVSGGILSLGTGGTGANTSHQGALGTGDVTLNPSGTLRLWIQNSGNFTVANNFNLAGGTLHDEDGIYHLSGTVAMNADSTVSAQWSGKDLFLDGTMSGSGKLLVAPFATNNGGAVVLKGNNTTFTGDTNITNLMLSLGLAGGENVNSLGTGLVTVNASGTLRFSPGSTASTFNIPNSIKLNGGTIWGEDGKQQLVGTTLDVTAASTLATSWSGKDLFVYSKLTGSLGVTIKGKFNTGDGGTVHIANGTNTYTGTTSVFGGSNPGSLSLDHNMALSSSTVDLATGSTLSFLGGVTTPVLGGLSGAGGFTNNVTLAVGNNGASTTYSGAIGGTGSLTKYAGGTLSLTGTSLYAGGTFINGGTISLGLNGGENVNSLGSGLVTINAAGMLRFSPGSTATVFNIPNSISLNGGTIWAEDGVQHLVGTTLDITAASTLATSWSGKDLFVDAKLTGSFDVTVKGKFTTGDGGTVHFTNGTNTYSGTIFDTASGANTGSVAIDHNAALSLATLSIGSGAGVSFGASATSPVLGALAGSGNLVNNVALSAGNNNSSTTYFGSISGSGSLTKIGGGTMSLTNANSFSGGLNVNAGTLKISGGGGNRLANNANVQVTFGAIFETAIDTNNTPTAGNAIDVTLNGGTYRLTGAGNAHQHVRNLTFNGGGTLETQGAVGSYTNHNVQLNGNLAVMGSGVCVINMQNGLGINGSHTFTIGDSTGSSASDLIFQAGGIIQSDSTAGQLIKDGAGTLEIDTPCTYTGTTLINAGLLLLNGSLVDGAAPVDVTPQTAGTLGGTGSIAGNVSIASGGKLDAGAANAAGTLALNNGLALASGSTFAAQIGSSTPGDGIAFHDQIAVQGSVALGNASLNASLINSFIPAGTDRFVLITNDGSDQVTGTFSGFSEGAKVTLSGVDMYITYAGDSANPAVSGNDVILTVQPVISGTSGPDTVIVTPVGGGNIQVTYTLNGVGPTTQTTTTPPTSFTFLGGDGDDNFIVNLTGNSNLLPPLFFDGEGQDLTSANPNTLGDVVAVNGTGVESATYLSDPTIARAGKITVAGVGVLNFQGTEPANMFGLAVANINFANANDLVTITNGFGATALTAGTPAIVVSGTSGGVAFEQVHLSGNTTVNLNTVTGGSDGNDTVTITSADNAHANVNFNISTGAGTDVVNINGAMSFAGAIGVTTANVNSTAAGTINTGSGLTVNNTGSASTLAGVISGPGGLTQNSTPQLTLSGNNTYTGSTDISGSGAELRVTGEIGNGGPAGTVTVNSGSTLSGGGIINAPVQALNGSTVSPGTSPGILSTGSVTLASGSNFNVEINGTTVNSQYDQLNVTGSVTLNDANLVVALGYSPANGHSFTIISNDGGDGVLGLGTFKVGGVSIPDGGSFIAGGNRFVIDYTAGTSNNDVTLTVQNIAGTLSGALDGSNNLVVTDIDPAGKNNPLTLSRSGGNLVISDAIEEFTAASAAATGGTLSNGNKTLTVPLGLIASSVTVLGMGGDDLFTVDYAGGPFGKTIVIRGGTPSTLPGDKLTLSNPSTAFPFVVDTSGGLADASNDPTLVFSEIERVSLLDTTPRDLPLGQFYSRGTSGPDYFQFTSAAQANPVFRLRIGNAYYPRNGGNYGPYLTAGTNPVASVYGRGSADTISMYNTRLNGALFGEDGDDILTGGYGNDLIVGGAGNDRLNGATVGGNDEIWGDDYNPAIDGVSIAAISLASQTGGGNDQINTFGGADTVYGQGGNDIINTGLGDDYINGGPNNDQLDGQGGNDRVYGGTGSDVASGSDGNDVVAGNDGNDTLYGRVGNDILVGGLGQDTVNGNEGSDALVGNESSGTGSDSRAKGDAADAALLLLLSAWGPSPLLTNLAGFGSASDDGSVDTLWGGADSDAFFAAPPDNAADRNALGYGPDL